MAIPDALFRLSWSGFYHDPTALPVVPLWRWALVWHFLQEPLAGTDDDFEGIHLAMLGWSNESTMPFSNGYMSQGTVIETATVDHLADGMGWVESPVATAPTGNTLRNPVSPQSAILIIGQTIELGRQTRKWLPCIDSSYLGDRVVGGVHLGVPLWTYEPTLLWASDCLSPKLNLITGAELTPVVWDAAGERAEPITRIRVQRWPRTIRRRTNEAEPLWYDP